MARDVKGRFTKGVTPYNKKEIDEEKVLILYKKGYSMLKISKLYCYKGTSTRISKLIKNKDLSRPATFQCKEKHFNWKEGKKNSNGYKYIRINGRYVAEHHLNWCIANEFPIIPKGCCVHHRDENRLNNKPDNLVLLTRSIHQEIHMAWRKQNGE